MMECLALEISWSFLFFSFCNFSSLGSYGSVQSMEFFGNGRVLDFVLGSTGVVLFVFISLLLFGIPGSPVLEHWDDWITPGGFFLVSDFFFSFLFGVLVGSHRAMDGCLFLG